MTHGVIMIDDLVIGTFKVTPWPHEELVMKFNEGLRVERVIQEGTKDGPVIRLITQSAPTESDGK